VSLILDALNRSRQDSEQVPGLASHHPVVNEATGSRDGLGWLQWLLVLGLACAVLVIGWLLFERISPAIPLPEQLAAELPAAATPAAPLERATRPEPAVPEQAAISVPPAIPAATASLQQPAAAPLPEPELAPAPVDASVTALYQQRKQSSYEQPTAAEPVSQPVKTPADVPAADSPREETVDIEQLVAKAEAELADAQLQDNGEPFLATLSQQTKDAIPTLMYQRHEYSGDPAKSSVVLNGKALRAGAAVGGVKVEEILPDSVVLDFQGTRFRLRALNSWVNL
jgi:general secretion pathway protein B